jgi:hypothetical protein
VDPWLERPLLPAADSPAPTRRVKYWEIGNEVETSLTVDDARSPRLVDAAIDLTPAEYVDRYLRITEALRHLDPDIQVGPSPNNPWGPRAGIENRHLIDLLARSDAVVDVLYYHYYMVWYGSYNFPADVSRNLRLLKNHGNLLHSQYAAHFARAGRTRVPAIVSEWNPDYTIHPPVERFQLSALATAEVFLTFVELQVLGAHYWENPDGRASRFVFDRLATHLGDRFLGSSHGNGVDDGSYSGFGLHPSSASDVRIYATRRTTDDKVFVWMLNFSGSTNHTVVWEHSRPVVEAVTHTLKNPLGATTLYTPENQLAWVSEPPRTTQPISLLPPATLSILELTYAPTPTPEPAPPIITAIERTAAPAGTELVITGDGFADTTTDNVVHFGLGRAAVLETSRSNLLVRVPATATYGPVTVTVGGRTAWSPGYFTLAFGPGRDEPVDAGTLVPLSRPIYPPEWAPIVTAPVELLLADWKADGRLHLASLSSRTGSVLPDTIDLFANTGLPGQPAFETPICDPQMPLCSLPLNSSPARIACADLDGDGLLDLACVDRHAWHVATWRNATPSPSVRSKSPACIPPPLSPSNLAVHDLDQDGRPDLDRHPGRRRHPRGPAQPHARTGQPGVRLEPHLPRRQPGPHAQPPHAGRRRPARRRPPRRRGGQPNLGQPHPVREPEHPGPPRAGRPTPPARRPRRGPHPR